MDDGTTLTDDHGVKEPLPLGMWLSVPIAAALLVYSLLIPGFFIRAVPVVVVTATIIACLRWTYAERNDQTGE